jgi:hypothetical protein
MRAKTKLIAPREMEPRAEHPHRCMAGHRWQHDGPAATTCVIPNYDPVLGDLPFVGSEDCPLCCGRTDLLVRGLHSHYCNMCDGDWKHDGYCPDSLAACCPWCFPKLDAEPVSGARSGPHFHVCSECGQNWRHATGCSAPLRSVLPECPGCRSASAPTEGAVQTQAPSTATASDGVRALGARLRSLARPVAAIVLLSIPLALKGYWVLRSPGIEGNAPAFEERIETPSLAPLQSASVTPPAPASVPAPTAPTPLAPTPPAPTPPARTASTPTPSAPAPSAPARLAPTSPAHMRSAPAPDPGLPPARMRQADRVRPSDLANLPLAPAPRPTPAPRNDASHAPIRDRVTEPQAQESPAAPSKPAPPAPRDLVAEAPLKAPEIPPTPSESVPPAAPARAALPSIPGAPPFAELSGSSGLDTSLDGHPRRANR